MNEWIRFTEIDSSEHCILMSTISRIDRYENKLYFTFFNEEDECIYYMEDEEAAKEVLDELAVSVKEVHELAKRMFGPK